MKRLLAVLWIVLFGFAGAAAADVSGDIAAVLRSKDLNKVEVGVMVAQLGESADATRIIFRSDSDIPLIPASNLKLITTAAALDQLGGDFKFRTTFALRDRGDSGRDVVVFGDGDPTLGDVEMLKAVGWGTTTVFDGWAEQLKKRGVTNVADVVVDDSVFDTEFVHPHWPANQIHLRYSAGVGGLNLNANAVDFYLTVGGVGQTVSYVTDPDTRYINVKNTCVRGNENAIWLTRKADSNDITLGGQTNANTGPVSVSIHDPSMFAATVLSETLVRNGITVSGSVRRDRAALAAYKAADDAGRSAWTLLAAHETPLAMVLARTNKDSMNMYAESLLKRLGHAASQQPGSWANGTAAAGAYLVKLGVPAEQFHLDDGCGLSKENRVSANTLATVLIQNFHKPTRDIFMQSLAIADIDGTFANRFSGTDLRGRVFGKSGYVNGVSTFSGYLKAKDGRWYVFSILMNNVRTGNAVMKQVQEKIVQAVDRG